MDRSGLPRVFGPCAAALALVGASVAWSAEPIVMRFQSFTVAPAHTPLAVVILGNPTSEPYKGTVRVKGPEGWLIVPAAMDVSVPAGGTARAAFTVQRGQILQANSYPLEATAAAPSGTVVHRQSVACASASYFKPKIDGQIDDWNDAIPATFATAGKKTTISTYWNRRQFAILVAVEEDNLVPWSGDASPRPCDAVQLAISPQDAPTAQSPDAAAGRYEFLLVASGSPRDGRWPARCFRLAEAATKLGQTQQLRSLNSGSSCKAEIVVSRQGKTTYYECAIPLKEMPEIQPGEGREFCLSVLVHDPDGTGLRDWGQAAGLWPSQRNRLAWSLWPSATWGKEPPLDNKTAWGMCSSKY
jgi:hypothetical protein